LGSTWLVALPYAKVLAYFVYQIMGVIGAENLGAVHYFVQILSVNPAAVVATVPLDVGYHVASVL
jgi:hypothetical protein